MSRQFTLFDDPFEDHPDFRKPDPNPATKTDPAWTAKRDSISVPSLSGMPSIESDQPKYILREYQRAAVDKMKWAMKLEGNDLLILPTGAGKSLVIAALAEELGRKVLILQPSKEILEQNYSKLRQYIRPDQIGIFSASMNRKDINYYTFATIGSVCKYPELFQDIGLIIIDECHLVNAKNDSGMYTQFIRDVNRPKVIGLTATPYRLTPCYAKERGYYGEDLLICQVGIRLINRVRPKGSNPFIWDRLLFNINNKELVDQGYLCPLRYEKADLIRQEDIPLNKTKSDFDLEAYEQKIKGKDGLIVEKIRENLDRHKSILFFCPSIAQAYRLNKITPEIEARSAVVTGKTPAKERARIIDGFKAGRIQIVFNVGVLTTGFDHPALDCIMLNRPTRSIGLYYQMLGRGVRTYPGKEFCRVIDFTNTVDQIGPIESLELVKAVDPELDLPGGKPKWNLKTSTGLWNGRILYRWVKELPAKSKSETRRIPDAFSDRANDLEF